MLSAQRILFFLLNLLISSEGAFYGHYMFRCLFNSQNTKDAVFEENVYFNKALILQYNSTVGKVIGYTKKGKEDAILLNDMPNFLKHEKWKTNRCKQVAQMTSEMLPTVPPYVLIRADGKVHSKHQHTLICSVYDFYPKLIKVTWLRDGKAVTSNVTSTNELPNGNWFYQLHTTLEYTPKPGEKISCMVEHASLSEPTLYDWEPKADRGVKKIAVGSAGLLLGLLFSITGFIYYKIHRTTIGQEDD